MSYCGRVDVIVETIFDAQKTKIIRSLQTMVHCDLIKIVELVVCVIRFVCIHRVSIFTVVEHANL